MVWGGVQLCLFFFCVCRYPVVTAPFVKRTSLPHSMVLALLLKISWSWLVCFDNSVPLLHTSILIPHWFSYCSFVVKSGSVSCFPLFFFNIVLAVWDPLPSEFEFYMYLRIGFSISGGVKNNAVGILIGDVLNLWVTLGSIVILNISSLPVCEHRMSLHYLGL